MLILAVLGALLLPAQRNAREAARRVECQNQMKHLCTAVMTYASTSSGTLPWLSIEEDEGIVSNWLVDLLPALDNSATLREWQALTGERRSEFEFSLTMFQCPEDPTALHVDGGLSYVANAGFGHFTIDPQTNAVYETKPHGQNSIDWDSDGKITKSDWSKTIATGAFWSQRDGDTFRSSLDYISAGDGQTNTFLLAESTNAGKWNSGKTLDIAFVVGLDRIQFANPGSDKECLKIAGADLGPYAPAGGNIPRHTPSPSSNHLGASIYGFADGAAHQISDVIDPLVYLRLMTPNGQRFGELVEGLESY